jgi:probable rRNA maturation factor
MAYIRFHSDYPGFRLRRPVEVRRWLRQIVAHEFRVPGEIQFVFCSDEALLELNRQYLAHDYYTDILTFDYSADHHGKISGDIYISIDRVLENAAKMSCTFDLELYRVMAHGILHLIGYKDHTKFLKSNMRALEDRSLLTLSADILDIQTIR